MKNERRQPPVPDREPFETIHTHVEASELRNESNDCGPLAIDMVMRSLNEGGGTNETLESLRASLKKEGAEGTVPGAICELASSQWPDVRYYSGIDWDSLATTPDMLNANLPAKWRKFIRGQRKHPEQSSLLHEEKMRESAAWLVAHPDILVKNQPVSLKNAASLLRDGARLIALVGGEHYVVITGVDGEFVWFQDPDVGHERSMNRAEFEVWWESEMGTHELIVINAQLPVPEVAKKVLQEPMGV